METKGDKTQTFLRLALCGAGAAGLYGAAVRLPALAERRAWLEEHRLEAIAVAAAVLFGLSLVLLPLPEAGEDGTPDAGPCAGYEPTEGPL